VIGRELDQRPQALIENASSMTAVEVISASDFVFCGWSTPGEQNRGVSGERRISLSLYLSLEENVRAAWSPCCARAWPRTNHREAVIGRELDQQPQAPIENASSMTAVEVISASDFVFCGCWRAEPGRFWRATDIPLPGGERASSLVAVLPPRLATDDPPGRGDRARA
jgi:hypothetical protein